MRTTTYTIDGKDFELRHYGVKGMKWGRRKARPQPAGMGRSRGQAAADSTPDEAARREARRAKAKRAAKIGAAVVGTALAVYGAKKCSDILKDKAYSKVLRRGNKALEAYKRVTLRSELDDIALSKGNSLLDPVKRMSENYDRRKKMEAASYKAASASSRNTVSAIKELLRKDPDAATTIQELAELSGLLDPVKRTTVSRAKVSRASW